MKLNLTTNTKGEIEVILVLNKKIKENKKELELLGFDGSDEACVILPHKSKLYVASEEDDSESVKIAYAIFFFLRFKALV